MFLECQPAGGIPADFHVAQTKPSVLELTWNQASIPMRSTARERGSAALLSVFKQECFSLLGAHKKGHPICASRCCSAERGRQWPNRGGYDILGNVLGHFGNTPAAQSELGREQAGRLQLAAPACSKGMNDPLLRSMLQVAQIGLPRPVPVK